MNSKVVAPVLASVAALGIVGGIAAAQAFKPVEKPQQQVRFVDPAAQTVTQTPTVAVTTPSVTATTSAPVKSVKVAVKSTPKATTTSVAPQTVQRQAIVSQDPTPVQTQPTQAAPAGPPPPPVKWGTNDQPPTPPSASK